MDQNSNIVTEADVLQASKVVTVANRLGKAVQLTVNALSWRAAVGATFKRVEDEVIHTLENCLPKEAQPLLESLTPASLVEVRNVALKLTHGVDVLKKSLQTANPAEASLPGAPATPSSTPPSAN